MNAGSMPRCGMAFGVNPAWHCGSCSTQWGLHLNYCTTWNSFLCFWGCRKFVEELIRVTKPGGKIALATWCHRNLLPGEATLKPDEEALLSRINEAYYLPPWCSLADYEKLFGVSSLAYTCILT